MPTRELDPVDKPTRGRNPRSRERRQRSIVYSDHSMGWQTEYNPMNQPPESLTYAKNCYFTEDGAMAKRQGYNTVFERGYSGFDCKNVIDYRGLEGSQHWLLQLDYVLFKQENQKYYHCLECEETFESETIEGEGLEYCPECEVDINPETFDIERKEEMISQARLPTNRRLGHTQYDGTLILGNDNLYPRKYFYLQSPRFVFNPEENVIEDEDSDLPARTLFVSLTYHSADGESYPSAPVRCDLSARERLKIPAPVQIKGALNWNVYVSVLRPERNLQAEKLDFEEDWIEPLEGINDTKARDYPTENTAFAYERLGGSGEYKTQQPPQADIWHTHNDRVFAGAVNGEKMALYYSALENEDFWFDKSWTDEEMNTYVGNPDGPGIIEFERVIGRGGEITGLESVEDKLIVFFEEAVVAVFFPEDHTQLEVVQVMDGVGCVSPWSVKSVAGEVFWLSPRGVEALSRHFGQEDVLFERDNPSSQINSTISKDIARVLEKNMEEGIDVTHYPQANWLIWNIPQQGSRRGVTRSRQYVYNLNWNTWSFFEEMDVNCLECRNDGQMYGGVQGNAIEMMDGTYDDDGEKINMIVSTPWLMLRSPDLNKKMKFLFFPAISQNPTEVKVRHAFDYDTKQLKPSANETTVDAPGVDYWDESEWDHAIWSDRTQALSKVPIRGRGTSVRFTFDESSTTEFILPWFRVDFVIGGKRHTTEKMEYGPQAIFDYETEIFSNFGGAYTIVRFEDESRKRAGHIVDWDWDFGDGFTSDLRHPTHIYEKVIGE